VDAGFFLSEVALPETRRCLERFFAWGAAPTVDAYCELFAADGTLLDADMAEPIRGDAIRDSIGRVLQLLPDFSFAPRRVLTDGPHAFVLAANRATLGERALAWDAIYALTLRGDRIGAGRRYYDQAALLTGADTFALGPSTPPSCGSAVGAVASTAPATSRGPLGAIDLDTRAAAWNRRDFRELHAMLGPVRLHLAGIARPLEDGADVRAALAALAARSEGLAVRPGAVVRTAAGTAIEWVGTIGVAEAARRFALVELCTALPERCEWRVSFNTLGL
jgi:ketosteroid isomerase-like protein